MALDVKVKEVEVPVVPVEDLLFLCLCAGFDCCHVLGLEICPVVYFHPSSASVAGAVVAPSGVVMPNPISILVPKAAPAPSPVHTGWSCEAGGHRTCP